MLKCPHCYSDRIHSRGATRRGTPRYRCSDCDRSTIEPISPDNIESVFKKDRASTRLLSNKKQRFVITAVQNATPVNTKFFEALQNYPGQLICIPFRYKNPSSLWSDKDQEWWDSRVQPYLLEERSYLHDNAVLLSDLKLTPTKVNPLTGLEGFTRNESIVVAHPKISLETVATHPGDMAKILVSTGALTIPNYTDSGLGKRGLHHHVHGALVVETDGDKFHIRHIQADEDGSFIDLDKEYTPEGVKDAPPAQALVLGDLHHWFMDESVDNAIFAKGGLANRIKPERIFLHDPVDNYACCPHHKGDPFISQGKYHYNRNSVKRELQDFADWLKERARDDTEYVIVSSNHSDWLSRWIKEADWKNDPENAEFYLETALYMTRNTKWTSGGVTTPDPFNYWMRKLLPFATVLGPEDSYMVDEVECGYHGHLGPSGARGSLLSMSKIGPKVMMGHVHSPGIRDGAVAVGVSTYLNLNYTNGPSSWMQTQGIIDGRGKMKLVNTIEGRFTSAH